MNKAPIPENEMERLAALRRYEILDSTAEATFDEITGLVVRLIGVPIALISLVDEDRQWFKSRVGLAATETARDIAFCAHAILADDLFVVGDALADQRFADNPLVQNDPGVRFYAGAPLVTHDGFRLGTLCAIDREPRQLSAEQAVLLGVLSQQVVMQLELRHALRSARQAEAALRSIFDHMEDVYYRVDANGMLQAISPSVRKYGYEPAELLAEGSTAALMGDAGAWQRNLQLLFERGTVSDIEIHLRGKDGTTAPFSLSARLLYDDEGRVAGREGILRDVSARKAVERQRNDFVAMVTHDIRNPASNVLGFVEMLAERDDMSAESLDLCAAIERNAKLIYALTNSFLLASRIESGSLQLEKELIVLGELLERVCDAHRSDAVQNAVSLTYRADAEVPLIVADGLAIERVFGNLLHNALKFTPRGGRVVVAVQPSAGGVRVDVSDSGRGINPREQSFLFERYKQGEVGAAHGGAGLGLFIVKSLVDAHGGNVAVHPTLGGGATFTVTLPIRA